MLRAVLFSLLFVSFSSLACIEYTEIVDVNQVYADLVFTDVSTNESSECDVVIPVDVPEGMKLIATSFLFSGITIGNSWIYMDGSELEQVEFDSDMAYAAPFEQVYESDCSPKNYNIEFTVSLVAVDYESYINVTGGSFAYEFEDC